MTSFVQFGKETTWGTTAAPQVTLPITPRIASKHPARAKVRLRCSGKIHTVIWKEGGPLALVNHDRASLAAQETLAALGGKVCPCVAILRQVRDGSGHRTGMPPAWGRFRRQRHEARKRAATKPGSVELELREGLAFPPVEPGKRAAYWSALLETRTLMLKRLSYQPFAGAGLQPRVTGRASEPTCFGPPGTRLTGGTLVFCPPRHVEVGLPLRWLLIRAAGAAVIHTKLGRRPCLDMEHWRVTDEPRAAIIADNRVVEGVPMVLPRRCRVAHLAGWGESGGPRSLERAAAGWYEV